MAVEYHAPVARISELIDGLRTYSSSLGEAITNSKTARDAIKSNWEGAAGVARYSEHQLWLASMEATKEDVDARIEHLRRAYDTYTKVYEANKSMFET